MKIGFEETWRWFGPNDPISLKEIKQTGATGIVTALHQIPVGQVWTIDEIEKRKKLIEDEGLIWSVVESVPVHENIKKQKDNFPEIIENYKTTLINLGTCGINTVCYNFMPVLDWSRTNLHVKYKDGSVTSKFEMKVFAAFDLFILKRNNVEKSYTPDQISKAKEFYHSLDDDGKKQLTSTILYGLPGSLEAYSLDEFKHALNEYDIVGEEGLRKHLYHFIAEITPVAEKAGISLAIHPDDPPFSLLGLPRIVSNKKDIDQILAVNNSPSNGITLCTGSLGAGYENDLVDLAQSFAHRVNFVHLRNVTRNADGDFLEENHLEGDVDMYGVIKTLLLEQKKRLNGGRKDSRIPMRPDHGHLMTPDQNRKGIYPGYSLFGRMRGLAELRGVELGIIRSLGL
jgi:mannonate dehydratase